MGILCQHDLQMDGRLIVVSGGLEQRSIEKIGARQLGIESQRLLDNDAGADYIAFLQGGASDVQPAIGILRIDLGDFAEGSLRRF